MRRNDEFYTTYDEIEDELQYYDFAFKDKIVYCNTDNEDSQFWRYFSVNFNRLGLRQLIATHIESRGSYKLVLNGQDQEPVRTSLIGNGAYNSEECLSILNSCDIVVTNPPFSIWRDYAELIINSGKLFIIIGNFNTFCSRQIFPYFKANKIWVGFTRPKYYLSPEGQQIYVGHNRWFTNVPISRLTIPLELTYSYYENPENYILYDNYDAIDVSFVEQIPYDYYDIMGVPITFATEYCPQQFEILGVTDGHTEEFVSPSKKYIRPRIHLPSGEIKPGFKINTNATVRTDDLSGTYYTADNIAYPVKSVYKRILIRRKQ